MGDEIIGSEVDLALSVRLAHCSEGNQQRQERAIESDQSKFPCCDNSLFLVVFRKSVRLFSQLRDIGQCDLLLDGCCDVGVRSVASEEERCDWRYRWRGGPECRVRKGSQRCVESGEDHEQANDDDDEVMRAHVGSTDEIALRRSTNRQLARECDLNPPPSARALLNRHCRVNIVRKIGNSCRMYTCGHACSILRQNY